MRFADVVARIQTVLRDQDFEISVDGDVTNGSSRNRIESTICTTRSDTIGRILTWDIVVYGPQAITEGVKP